MTTLVYALTSLSPDPNSFLHQQKCIETWRKSGLDVRAFQHPSEVSSFSNIGVEIISTSETSETIFGRPYVKINAMLDWALQNDVQALLINSDIEMQVERDNFYKCAEISKNGLCYFTRFDYKTDYVSAKRQQWGIDAFLLSGRHAELFPRSFLSMGQPWWDYWLPHAFAINNLPIWSMERYQAIYHKSHPQRWSQETWHKCAIEFNRMYNVFGTDKSVATCQAISTNIRSQFESIRVCL